jgi:uncharacterized protein (DUF1697 family)
MTTYIGLLRGINVGGNKMVAMADLRDMMTKIGFSDVKTVLQSGNIVFRGGATLPAELESQLEPTNAVGNAPVNYPPVWNIWKFDWCSTTPR